MALPLFAITLFVSAFLLFLVQPMIGKMILPRLGGTPQVWNTCMVFFQIALLCGYAYTHVTSTFLKVRTQLLAHGALLVLPLLLFAFGTMTLSPTTKSERAPGTGTVARNSDGETAAKNTSLPSYFYAARESLNPITGGNPILQTLGWLAWVVGLPFFVVATSAPLLQRWFGHTGHPAGKDPYFLYGASNIGSFASLVAYPLFLEWLLPLNEQSWLWVVGYALLAALVVTCAVVVWKAPPSVRLASDADRTEPAPAPLPQETKPEPQEEAETRVKAGPPPKGGGATSFKKGSKQKKKDKSFVKERPEKVAPSVARTTRPGVARVAAPDPRLAPVTPLRRLRWIALAAIPSSLMLGVTTHITTDLSPIPLLWLIPLMLYLLSFVLVFAKWPIEWVGIPHMVMVVAQPFAVALLLLSFTGVFGYNIVAVMLIEFTAFALTTMVCHGELAKDRPRMEHLTEFYLLMSVGGMLGGMFNALLAPILFVYQFVTVLEYTLAIFLAGFLRPVLFREGMIEYLFAKLSESSSDGHYHQPPRAEPAPNAVYYRDVAFAFGILLISGVMLFVAPLVTPPEDPGERGARTALTYGVPLLLTPLLMGRPLRYALAIGSILLIMGIRNSDDSIWRDRSYFGIIKVRVGTERSRLADGKIRDYEYTGLTHATTYHGQNYRKPADVKDWGKPEEDFSRLATTYYHQRGPAGVIMQKMDWFKDYQRVIQDSVIDYKSDARMPASLVGFGWQPLSFGNLPVGPLVDLWSEPPFAVIGLGTGTMASYARPFQHCHFYEIDNAILRLSVPLRFLSQDRRAPTDTSLPRDLYVKYLQHPLGNRNSTYFTYLADAKARGSDVWVFMGDARLRMAQPYDWNKDTMSEQWNNAYSVRVIDSPTGGGPDKFYHVLVVDAFSSDAIPVHLITKEAIRMYFTKLAEEGILCVHTSNRYVDLVPVVAAVADSLNQELTQEEKERGVKYAWRAGSDGLHERGDLMNKGRSLSTWIMVARKVDYLISAKLANGAEVWTLDEPEGYTEALQRQAEKYRTLVRPFWRPVSPQERLVWTDDFSNLMAVFRPLAGRSED